MAPPQALGFLYNPLTARRRIKMRWVYNLLFAVLIFTPLAISFKILFTNQTAAYVADAITILTVAIFYFIFWDKRAIWIQCPYCHRYIATNTPWVCGFCQQKNTRTDEFPFVNRCEHEACSAETRAYKCHHSGCGYLIFLSEDKLEQNYAQCLNAPVEDIAKDEISQQEREKRAKEHALLLADLEEKLDGYRRRRELGEKKPPREVVRTAMQNDHDQVMGAEEWAAEQRALINEKYKNDPKERKRKHMVIDDLLRKHI